MLVPLPVITRLQATDGVMSGHEATHLLVKKQGQTQQDPAAQQELSQLCNAVPST